MKKVLIMTLEQGTNYGGMLQAYALQSTLKKIGFDAETSASTGVFYKRMLKSVPGLKAAKAKLAGKHTVAKHITAQHTQRFINQHIALVEYKAAVRKARRNAYDAYIVGSDQVWRKPYTYVPHNLFSFVPGAAPRISYAASFGRDDLDEYGDELIVRTKQLAQRFTAISVREDTGVGVVKKNWGLAAEHHVDPTLLVDAKEYAGLVEQDGSLLKDSNGEIFSYVLDLAPEKQGIVDVVARMVSMTPFTIIEGDENNGAPMPAVTQWLKSFMDAKYVVTDSFHGTVFSIIFNKPFVAVGNKNRGLARFQSLLKIFGLEDRLVESIDDVTKEMITRPIDWTKVNKKIKAEQKRSLDYLKKNLV